jgi:alpha-1,2-mannosyltransferase
LLSWIHSYFRLQFLSLVTLISPFFLWLAIFTLQPHKEERFMYVAYSSLCLNAALSLDAFSALAQSIASVVGLRHFVKRRVLVVLVLITSAVISLARSSALAIYYGAPIEIMLNIPDQAGNVCVGREWYRFPSSYFLHQGQRLKFVKSGFSGLLPGEFIESEDWWWKRDGTWIDPPGMNNQNLEDFSKYVSVHQCNIIVDTSSPVDASVGEILFTEDSHYTHIYCTKFLNSAESTGIARILWVPHFLHPYFKSSLSWDNYCVLQQVEDISTLG